MKNVPKFEALFQHDLEALYDAEKQIVDALPKLMAASSSAELSSLLESDLEDAKEQLSRLEEMLEKTAESGRATECKSMKALLEECETLIGQTEKSPVLDVALIAAARKVKHYEIASYATTYSLAEMLGAQEVCGLLQESLQEETDADEVLGEIADSIMTGSDETKEENETEDSARGSGASGSRRVM